MLAILPRYAASSIVRMLAMAAGAGRRAELLRNLRRAQEGAVITPWHRQQEVIFIHVPRTAGTSLRAAIGDPTPPGFEHTAAQTFRTLDPDLFARAFSFAVVRDPVERFCSAFSHIQKYRPEDHDPIFRMADGITDPDEFLHSFETSGLFRARIFAGLHFQRQSYYVCDPNGRLLVDDLIPFETLAGDLPRKLEPVLGHRVHLAWKNPSGGALRPGDLSTKAKRRLRRHYRRDFRLHRQALAGATSV